MKKLQIALIALLLPALLISQERKEIKKTKKMTVLRTWKERDGNNQLFYYTSLGVDGDEKYHSYILKVVKYDTDNERHPLKDRILMVSLYPDHEDNRIIIFFGCTSQNGYIERRSNDYLYCTMNDRLLIVKHLDDDTFIPLSLIKEGRFDDLIETYKYLDGTKARAKGKY